VQQIRLIAVLLVTYIGFYFCRTTLSTALPEVQAEFDYSKGQVGQIASYYFAVYAAAKLFNGFLGARLAAKAMLLLGIAGSVVCNVAFAFGRDLSFFSTVWSVNAFFQSMGWIAVVGIVSQWFVPTQSGKALGTISISYLVGDSIARVSAGLILGLDACGWRELFWIHAAVLASIGLAVGVLLKPNPESAGLPDIQRLEKREPELSSGSAENLRLITRLLTNRHFGIVCSLYLCLSMIRYAFWIWSVVYLTEACGLTLGASAMASAVLPLAGAFGALLAGYGSDRPDVRRGPVLTLMTAALVIVLGLFLFVPTEATILQVLSLALAGFFMIGPYSLIAGAVAVDFGSKRLAATASGIIDAVGALGAIAMGAGMGSVVDQLGWSGAFASLIGIGAVALVLCLTLWNTRFDAVNE
jgi:sugar phosphate permease